MNAKALYIRGERITAIKGGADLVSQSIQAMLRRYFAGNLEEIYINELSNAALTKAKILKSALHGSFEPYGKEAQNLLMQRLEGLDFVFVDQSVFGRICEDIRHWRRQMKSAVLFHNIERNYYIQRAIRLFRIHNLILVPAIVRAERAAIATADLVIAVSERDAQLMSKIYGRKPDLIVGAPIQDVYTCPAPENQPLESPDEATMLFVGSAFPPNVQGIRWFVRSVMPHVPGRLVIVGSGFEKYRQELARDNVQVVGTVEDTSEWYRKAHCVVSPVFWGQGIKVKTAEAYMHGKLVIGTREAFEGYDYKRAGSMLATTTAEWINTLRGLAEQGNMRTRAVYPPARSYYEQELSFDAQYRKFSAALDRILAGETI